MAEGFEPYHVPQQSRREKLRGCADNLHDCEALLPLYDPSLISSDLLTCTNDVKHGGAAANFMIRYVNGGIDHNHNNNNNNNPPSSSSSYIDPQSAMQINPNNMPLLYQSFNGGYEPLSLSLSSNRKYCQSNVPLELNLQRYECSDLSGNDLSRSTVPLGPFTGYASILKGSRFLKPAQQLLQELCDFGAGNYAEKVTANSDLTDPPLMEDLSRSGVSDDGDIGVENQRKKSRLVSMLDEVYKKYKQYYQQVQAVVASFETVAGLSTAAPFANLALKAMSKHFRFLKNAITDQLQFSSTKFQAHKETAQPSNLDGALYGQRPIQNLGFIDHQPVWRPQRGLPERAVTVLRAWLFEHFLHPYPTDTDKLLLAKQTGLSRNQVSNWFINARVRLWKPMVEEIHTLETRQLQNPSQDSQNAINQTNPNFTENLSTSTQRLNQDLDNLPSKRIRNDNFPQNPIVTEERTNFLYNPSSRDPSIGGVSLTLGLHQNNGGVVLSEPFPINAARRFGLDSSNEGFVMGGFGRDVIGGQLLHDFVG